jgi:hypothetical protein
VPGEVLQGLRIVAPLLIAAGIALAEFAASLR